MSSRKKQDNKFNSILLLVGIIVLISFIASIFEYIASAIAIVSVILILRLGIGMIVHGYKGLKLQEERYEREMKLREEQNKKDFKLQEERAERAKWKEIEYNAIERNAELKYQDKEDNHKHYLNLYK